MIEWWGPVLFEFYGGTEGGGVMIGAKEWLRKPGSVGRPRPGVRMQILDERGTPVPPGTEGTIAFEQDETPFVYKDAPEKTAESRIAPAGSPSATSATSTRTATSSSATAAPT